MRRFAALAALAALLTGAAAGAPPGAAAKKPKVFTKACQIPAGKTLTCVLRLPKTGKYRSARYDLGYSISAVRDPAAGTPPDLTIVERDLVSAGENRRLSVRVKNPNPAGTAPALVRLRATVTRLR
ncbi:MAG: hypothetical protein MUC84_06515 [Solirubrobacteraceae bacterium]|jgi:hypothetical protein|nr:hypothetical protein [Solirubrobacteraceae bacterium]